MNIVRPRAWLAYLTIGFVVSGVAVALQSSLTIGFITQLAGWSSVLIGLGIARRSRDRKLARPWQFFGLAASAFLIAGVVRAGESILTGVARPFPSIADAIALSGHVLLIIGSTLLGHLRSPDRNRAAIIDGAILAVALQTIVWSWLLWPYMNDASTAIDDRAINAIYAFMTMAVLATIGRLGVGPGARTLSYRLLAAAVLTIFLQDVLVTVSTIDGSPGSGIGPALAPLIFVLFGAAALHPDRLRIAEASDQLEVRLSNRRVAMLIVALLVNPAILGIQLLLGINPSLIVAAVSTTVLTLLILIRFVTLARAQERAVAVQRIQREANAELAAATSRHAMHRAALLAAMRLIDSPRVRVSVAQATNTSLRIVDAAGHKGTDALGVEVAIDELPVAMVNGLDLLQVTSIEGIAPVDIGPSSDEGELAGTVLLAPLGAQKDLRGALIVTSQKPIALTVRQSVETLASTVSLALESAALTEDLLRRRSERRFRALVDNSSDIVLVINEEGLISFASPAAHRLLGLTEQAIVGSHPARWLHAEDWPILVGVLDASDSANHGDDGTLEVRFRHIDGSYRWFELRSQDLTADPEIKGVVVTAREVTDRKATEQLLATSEARFRALVQNSSDVVAVIDASGRYAYVSPAVTEMLGYTPDELEGRDVASIVDPGDLSDLAASYPGLLPEEIPDTPFAIRRFEAQVRHKGGEMRTLDVGVADMRSEPAIAGIVLNARDVTVRKSLEHDLRHQAMHDALTGLANRTLFTDRAGAALQARGTRGSVAALFIDLDDFKTVNDSLGHATGDKLLREVATRLEAHLTGVELAARLGGDEFAVLVTSASDDGQIDDIAQKIIELVAQPFQINDREIRVTCSVGIALARGQKLVESKVLLSSADVAMYVAKDRGKNCAAVFEEHLHASVFKRLEMKADLNRAVEDGQLICLYQPIVSLQTGRISGVEALVRWDHPTRGRLGPDAFIPLAEDTGIVVALGRTVLRQACRQLRAWQDQLPDQSSLTMSVNLSVRQLDHGNIIADVREAIEDAGIDASTLTLEITETSLMHDTEVTRHRLAQLRELGVSLAVDDFGTGYSSLQYVQRFPIDILKIDQTFVAGLGTSAGDNAVVQSMIELAQRLGVHAVAEGIETAEQLALLRSLGADLGQGFLFSRPVPAADIDTLVLTQPAGRPHFSLH